MLLDQQKAEKEKLTSEQLQKELAISLEEIKKKRTEVQRDLAKVSANSLYEQRLSIVNAVELNMCFKSYIYYRLSLL